MKTLKGNWIADLFFGCEAKSQNLAMLGSDCNISCLIAARGNLSKYFSERASRLFFVLYRKRFPYCCILEQFLPADMWRTDPFPMSAIIIAAV